jgi:hypothetical protein
MAVLGLSYLMDIQSVGLSFIPPWRDSCVRQPHEVAINGDPNGQRSWYFTDSSRFIAIERLTLLYGWVRFGPGSECFP